MALISLVSDHVHAHTGDGDVPILSADQSAGLGLDADLVGSIPTRGDHSDGESYETAVWGPLLKLLKRVATRKWDPPASMTRGPSVTRRTDQITDRAAKPGQSTNPRRHRGGGGEGE